MNSLAWCLVCALFLLLPASGQRPEGRDNRTRPAGARAAPPGDAGSRGGVIDPGITLSDRMFYVKTLGARCLDFGGEAFWTVGGAVIIFSCNGTVAQQVRVKEIDDSHDVELRVRDLFCIGVRGASVAPGRPLELQACNGSPAQRFALDGDAILMGTQTSGHVTRELVVEPEQDRTPSRTPLVVGTREVSDAEYFRFEAVDRSTARPTTGFVTVESETRLDWALSLGWGTVIEIDDRQPLVITGAASKTLNAGVTLRGYRKHTYNGPEIVKCTASTEDPAFAIASDNVRVTGFRLRGPTGDSRCPSGTRVPADAIKVSTEQGPRVLIDHLDASYWTGSGLYVFGGNFDESQCCPVPPLAYPRPTPARAVGNFLHHNGAYGVVTGRGAFALAQGNVFYEQHNHSVASDPWRVTGYAAYDNLVLSPSSGDHDFDAHGSLHVHHWYDGLSGDYYDIASNTFLQTSETNIKQRGTPCRFMAIHDNVFLQSKGDAIETLTKEPSRHVVWANAFGAPNPTDRLAVGDFDGDRVDDVFVGTGAAWYFSSGGKAEWRFLNRMPEHAGALRFGDFDGDLRTDVVALHNGNIDISWGGVSPWQTINVTAWTLGDIAVGDFTGDRIADLFLATGTEWFVAPGGRNWTPFAQSSYKTSRLLIGDFDHDGRSDVLGVVDGQWQIVPGGGSQWTPFGPALASNLTGLVVADFNGDGSVDIGRTSSGSWQFSAGGHGSWTNLRSSSIQLAGRPIGRFDGNATADVILWDGVHFSYAPSGRNPVTRHSRQAMR